MLPCCPLDDNSEPPKKLYAWSKRNETSSRSSQLPLLQACQQRLRLIPVDRKTETLLQGCLHLDDETSHRQIGAAHRQALGEEPSTAIRKQPLVALARQDRRFARQRRRPMLLHHLVGVGRDSRPHTVEPNQCARAKRVAQTCGRPGSGELAYDFGDDEIESRQFN